MSKVKTEMMDVFLIRHGEYTKCELDKDCVLTNLGRTQAIEAGRRLYSKLNELSCVRECHVSIFSSTMQRAKETTELLLQNDDLKKLTKHVIYDDKYREICLRTSVAPTTERELFHVMWF